MSEGDPPPAGRFVTREDFEQMADAIAALGEDPRDKRIRDLEAALRGLTAASPLGPALPPVPLYVDEGDRWCPFCPAYQSIREDGTAFPHAPDCPWVRAKALLAGSGDADASGQ